jgi:hypothetical protein
MEYLTDRLFGKAQQSIDLNASCGIDYAGELAEARKRVRQANG